jgi:murein DD-endopeptidase MepM/ murein hydrolase activator NlpD
MRKWLAVVLAALLVCAVCGVTIAESASSQGTTSELVEMSRVCAERPLEAPAELTVSVPADARAARVVYEQLSYGDGYERLEAPAAMRDGLAIAVIPAEHTIQPGIKYHWEVDTSDRALTTSDRYLPFFEEGFGALSLPGDQIAHDIEFAAGKLPDGTSVSSGQGGFPYNTGSFRAITSKLLEVRPVTESEVHKGVDWDLSDGTQVLAMQAGVVYSVGYDSKAGYYVYLSHGGGKYFTHYFHLQSYSVANGDNVTKGQVIALSGHSGGVTRHLDAGYDIFISGNRVSLYPFKYFMGAYSPYLSTDFDFIQKPTNSYSTTYGSYTSVKVEPKGSAGGTVHAYMVYRQKGTTTWYADSIPVYSGITYRYYWDPSLDGQTMQYYIKVSRALVTPEEQHFSTRPAKYHGASPGIYYEITVRKGSASAPPQS